MLMVYPLVLDKCANPLLREQMTLNHPTEAYIIGIEKALDDSERNQAVAHHRTAEKT